MLSTWKNIIHKALYHPDFFHVSGKRISQNVIHTSPIEEFLKPDFTLDMLGYKARKAQLLDGYYFVQESVDIALEQLTSRRKKNTYGSTGITTYGHFSKRERPEHGPCMTSIVLTHIPPDQTNVTVSYRSSEVFKKFGADLVWLHQKILPIFDPRKGGITFFFSNLTYHPQYWSVLVPYITDPVAELKKIKKHDPILYNGTLRWVYRFVNNDPSMLKFRQSFRVGKHLKRLSSNEKLLALKDYVNSNYTPKKFLALETEDELD